MNADIDKAKRIIAEEIERHPKYNDTRTDEEKENGKPVVEVKLIRFTDFAKILRGATWASSNAVAFEMYFDLLESIKKRFDTEGVEIPYPQYVISQKAKTTETTD